MNGAARLVGDHPLTVAEIMSLAEAGNQIALSPAARARVVAARNIVDIHARGAAPVYGLNTGLGGNVTHRFDPLEADGHQVRVIVGRMVGMGEPFPPAVSRAALLCRIVGLAQGGAGISPRVLDQLVAMFNAGVTPVVPTRGSLGAGDLALCAHLAAVAVGHGTAWVAGVCRSGIEALAAVGLAPIALAPKDGLGLINASCVSVAHGAFVLHELSGLLRLSAAVAALAFEGFGGNPAIFDARLAAARPAPGQAEAAALFRALLEGGSPRDDPVTRVQDALSFRVLAPVFGTTLTALRTAVDATEAEANATSDNPLVLIDDGEILSTANFHTPAMALAFDTMAIALCGLASAGAQRTIKLMNAALTGLPKYLSPVGGASNGFNSMQKTVAALHAELRLRATPVSLDSLAVSETVEDHAPHTPLAIRKLSEQLPIFRMLVAIEAMTAAQAIDLRGKPTQGQGTKAIYQAIRATIPMLHEDRPLGHEAMVLTRSLAHLES